MKTKFTLLAMVFLVVLQACQKDDDSSSAGPPNNGLHADVVLDSCQMHSNSVGVRWYTGWVTNVGEAAAHQVTVAFWRDGQFQADAIIDSLAIEESHDFHTSLFTSVEWSLYDDVRITWEE